VSAPIQPRSGVGKSKLPISHFVLAIPQSEVGQKVYAIGIPLDSRNHDTELSAPSVSTRTNGSQLMKPSRLMGHQSGKLRRGHCSIGTGVIGIKHDLVVSGKMPDRFCYPSHCQSVLNDLMTLGRVRRPAFGGDSPSALSLQEIAPAS